MADKTERRQKARIDVRWPINVLVDENVIDGETKNISLDGISITCKKALRINNTYQIFILPPDHQVIKISGKVMWSDMYGIDDEDNAAVALGACFLEISDEDSDFLKEVISKHQE